jgi:hypothetical protein
MASTCGTPSTSGTPPTRGMPLIHGSQSAASQLASPLASHHPFTAARLLLTGRQPLLPLAEDDDDNKTIPSDTEVVFSKKSICYNSSCRFDKSTWIEIPPKGNVMNS